MCSLCMRSAWEDMNNEQKTYENYRGQERHTLPRKQQRNNEEEEATAENQAKDHCVIRKSYVSKVEGKEFIQMKKKSIKMKRICMIQEVKIIHMADS